jgi:DNA-directed RNA polymerase subunit H (RpoH/RPB5)
MSSPNETLSQVYQNIFKFMVYRGLTPVDHQLDTAAFIEEIYNNDYIVIQAKQKIHEVGEVQWKPVKIVLLHHAAQQTMKAQDFKKIINHFTEKWLDIMFITQGQMSTHVSNHIIELNSKPKVMDLKCVTHEERFCNCGKNTIYTYRYMRFIIEIPKHVMVPNYETLNRQQEVALLEELRCKKHNLPGIQRSDPMVVWSTAIKGSIIKIDRVDDVSGRSVYYRIVI